MVNKNIDEFIKNLKNKNHPILNYENYESNYINCRLRNILSQIYQYICSDSEQINFFEQRLKKFAHSDIQHWQDYYSEILFFYKFWELKQDVKFLNIRNNFDLKVNLNNMEIFVEVKRFHEHIIDTELDNVYNELSNISKRIDKKIAIRIKYNNITDKDMKATNAIKTIWKKIKNKIKNSNFDTENNNEYDFSIKDYNHVDGPNEMIDINNEIIQKRLNEYHNDIKNKLKNNPQIENICLAIDCRDWKFGINNFKYSFLKIFRNTNVKFTLLYARGEYNVIDIVKEKIIDLK